MTPIGKTIREMMKSRNLLIITITQSLFMLTASLWWPYWSLYILELGVGKTLLGMIFMAETIAQLIFQILAERHERKPVIITTNMGFGDWTQIFGDANMTAALLDRVTHKAHVINCSWDSYRLKETLKNKKRSPK